MRLQTSLINYSLCSVPFLFHSAQVQHVVKVEGMLMVRRAGDAVGGGGDGGGGGGEDPEWIKKAMQQAAQRGKGWETPGLAAQDKPERQPKWRRMGHAVDALTAAVEKQAVNATKREDMAKANAAEASAMIDAAAAAANANDPVGAAAIIDVDAAAPDAAAAAGHEGIPFPMPPPPAGGPEDMPPDWAWTGKTPGSEKI